MKYFWLITMLLFATIAFGDNVDKFTWNQSLKQFQAQTHANGTKNILSAIKTYVSGTAYTNGTPVCSSVQAGYAIIRCVLVPYQTVEGAWRLKFNWGFTFTGITVTVPNISNFTATLPTGTVTQASGDQTVPWMTNNTGIVAGGARAIANGNSIQIYAMNADTGTPTYTVANTHAWNFVTMSGDIELASKPTWAD